uniref:Uncharacterized protein n=1 Tax=Lotharella globosa TaxID=91324 RepID=A0A7S4DIU5_9EUKA
MLASLRIIYIVIGLSRSNVGSMYCPELNPATPESALIVNIMHSAAARPAISYAQARIGRQLVGWMPSCCTGGGELCSYCMNLASACCSCCPQIPTSRIGELACEA